MFTQLKNQFFQTTLATFIWLLFLLFLFQGNVTLSLYYVLRLLGIAIISGGLFGILYPYIWEYTTWPATINILVSSSFNFLGGFLALLLFSFPMFNYVAPYWWGVASLTLMFHILAFYFYKKHQNEKLSLQLNKLTQR